MLFDILPSFHTAMKPKEISARIVDAAYRVHRGELPRREGERAGEQKDKSAPTENSEEPSARARNALNLDRGVARYCTLLPPIAPLVFMTKTSSPPAPAIAQYPLTVTLPKTTACGTKFFVSLLPWCGKRPFVSKCCWLEIV